ncbi:hypothetical protein L6164_001565 [Bauhinia variegata]|uniref:Uncharacterized protein n=1 Tax=Bauhinia variegata TaxID=167791 RepID=A0ACB9QA14_BAUVA|nr:hypothetical protein L6164_001565 [Bauhinia variegata]
MSSLAGKVETDILIDTSAEEFYDVFCIRTHQMANICPKVIDSVDLLEGEWGTEGSIILWKFLVDGRIHVSKEVVETLNKEDYSITCKVIEGDLLQHFKSFKFIVQVTPKDKGSVVHWAMEYEKQHDHIPDPHSMIQAATVMVEDIDAHITRG